MTYIVYPMDDEPEDIIAQIVAELQARFPGWEPVDGALETVLIEAFSAVASDQRSLMTQVTTAIFRFFGSSLLRLPPIDATSAVVHATVTAIDSLGHTLNRRTQIGVRDSSGRLWAFQAQTDVTILPGDTTTGVGEVVLVSVLQGEALSGLGGLGVLAELIDVIDWVGTVTLTEISTGGVDAEPDSEYLDRLSAKLQLFTPRPILPRDFSILSRDIPGIWRTVTIDGYNPDDDTTDNERMVCLFSVDQSGAPVSAGTKIASKAYLESLRETTFIVKTDDPEITSIDVTYKISVLPGYDPTTIVADVDAALEAMLDPANWGVPPFGDEHDWVNSNTLRYLEVSSVINGVEGVDFITTTGGNYDLTVGVSGGGLARVDVALAGVVSLPAAGTMTGTHS